MDVARPPDTQALVGVLKRRKRFNTEGTEQAQRSQRRTADSQKWLSHWKAIPQKGGER